MINSPITSIPTNQTPLDHNRSSSISLKSRLIHTAHEFEAQLLGSVFGALEKSFREIGGNQDADGDPGADTYQSVAMQALGTGLSASGGAGIAAMIVRHWDRYGHE